jgi:hypothetical protein
MEPRNWRRPQKFTPVCDGSVANWRHPVTFHAPGLPPGRHDGRRYHECMSALPAEPLHDDPLDPLRILGELPASERGAFLAQYRQAVEGAREPAGWGELQRTLRLWSLHAVAASQPGYQQARDTALAGTGGGMLLDDAIRRLRESR